MLVLRNPMILSRLHARMNPSALANHSRRFYLCLFLLVLAGVLAVLTVLRHWTFMRGSVGDILVVPLMVFFMLIFVPLRAGFAAGLGFAIAVLVEGTQYFHLADRLGLPRHGFWHQLLGNTFSLQDVLMYGIGAVLSFLVIARQQRRAAPGIAGPAD